jgi:hypothetical protein
MLPESPTGLYWSIRGEVACAKHVPDGERWKSDGWQPLPISYRGALQCQHCAPDHTAIVNRRTEQSSMQSDS